MNLAFLGCGRITWKHSRTIEHLRLGVGRWYASRERDRAAAFSRELAGAGHFGSYAEAIASPKIDTVFIATPPAGHLDLALAALAAGKHVIVEKPPFLRASDFDAVRAARDRAGRQVLVAENYFYRPLAVRLRRLLREGVIGEVLFLQVNALKRQMTSGWRDDPALAGGGALLEGGIHWINFIANLGFEVASVEGFRPGRRDGLERSVLVAFQYAEGATGTLAYSWEVPSFFRGLRLSRVFGREGSITFETNGLFLLVHGRRNHLMFPGLTDMHGFRAMFLDFFAALAGNREPQLTLARARRDVEIVEAVYRSMDRTELPARG